MGYYKVHCIRCGSEFSSSVMAFDFDSILKRSLELNRSLLLESELDPFKEIKLGLYFTFFQLQSIFGVTEGLSRVQMKPGDILDFVNEKYDVDIAADFCQEGDLLGSGFDSMQFMRFCDGLQVFHGNKDLNQEQKAENVKAICRFLVEHRTDTEPILDCMVQVKLDQNDTPTHDRFPCGIEITYADGRTREFVNHMVCVHCGSPLFKEAGKYQEYIIGMVGSARVGKTAYLAALINDLKPLRGRSDTPNVSVISDNDENWQRFEQLVLTPYREGRKIQKTEVIDEMVSLFTVHMLVNDRNYLFTFVDMPGEAFVPPESEKGSQDFSFVVEKRPILKHTDIFWFCIAPIQIDARLENRNGADSGDDVVDTNMNKVIGYIRPVLQYINNERNLKAAILLTMSDEVPEEHGLFDPVREHNLPLTEGTSFRWDRFVNWAQKVKSYFENANVTDLKNDFRVMFSHFNYFAIAAYGRRVMAGSDREMRGNLPSHVKDPFIWTLAALGLLQPVTYETRDVGRFIKKKQEGLWPVDPEYLYTK